MNFAKITDFFTTNAKGILITVAVIVALVFLIQILRKGVDFIKDPLGLDDDDSKKIDINIPPDTNVGTGQTVGNVSALIEELIDVNTTYFFPFFAERRCKIWGETAALNDRALKVVDTSYLQATNVRLKDALEAASGAFGECEGVDGVAYQKAILARLENL